MNARRARRRIPAGLVGMLALVAVAEGSLRRRELEIVLPWSLDWRVHGENAVGLSEGCDLLIFGDSVAKFGLIPDLIDGERGGRSYNLALCNGQATTSYFLLRRLIDSGTRPKAVVIDFTPHMLARGPNLNDRNWPELLSVSEALELARETRDADLFGRVIAAENLDSIRLRGELRDLIADSLAGVRYRHGYGTLRYLRNWRVNRGANLMPPIPFEGDPATWHRENMPGWAVDGTNLVYLDRFLRLAGREGIQVYWLLAPPSEGLQRGLEADGIDADHERFVRAVASQHAQVSVLDARHAHYPQEAHAGDPLHPSLAGAITLSVDVGRAIRDAEAAEVAPSWIVLPRYRPLESRVKLEDVEDSRLAVDDFFRGVRR